MATGDGLGRSSCALRHNTPRGAWRCLHLVTARSRQLAIRRHTAQSAHRTRGRALAVVRCLAAARGQSAGRVSERVVGVDRTGDCQFSRRGRPKTIRRRVGPSAAGKGGTRHQPSLSIRYNRRGWMSTREVQEALHVFGVRACCGPVDGSFGPATMHAVRGMKFHHAYSLKGLAGQETSGTIREDLYAAGKRGDYTAQIPLQLTARLTPGWCCALRTYLGTAQPAPTLPPTASSQWPRGAPAASLRPQFLMVLQVRNVVRAALVDSKRPSRLRSRRSSAEARPPHNTRSSADRAPPRANDAVTSVSRRPPSYPGARPAGQRHDCGIRRSEAGTIAEFPREVQPDPRGDLVVARGDHHPFEGPCSLHSGSALLGWVPSVWPDNHSFHCGEGVFADWPRSTARVGRTIQADRLTDIGVGLQPWQRGGLGLHRRDHGRHRRCLTSTSPPRPTTLLGSPAREPVFLPRQLTRVRPSLGRRIA